MLMIKIVHSLISLYQIYSIKIFNTLIYLINIKEVQNHLIIYL